MITINPSHQQQEMLTTGSFIRELAEPCEAVWRITLRDDKASSSSRFFFLAMTDWEEVFFSINRIVLHSSPALLSPLHSPTCLHSTYVHVFMRTSHQAPVRSSFNASFLFLIHLRYIYITAMPDMCTSDARPGTVSMCSLILDDFPSVLDVTGLGTVDEGLYLFSPQIDAENKDTRNQASFIEAATTNGKETEQETSWALKECRLLVMMLGTRLEPYWYGTA
ncbi:hypothetical protein VP01_2709g1 [Puccinia sorghi]|uniref:Uncharacterized protein n=1 Tax=Puccinia sorghi TaxID=27349 RepID=A0A0L6V5B6_9BASI|nr:hypothetical protein VP01_2709g1 [Puccinia sorghi]